jgi:hypothetical protein
MTTQPPESRARPPDLLGLLLLVPWCAGGTAATAAATEMIVSCGRPSERSTRCCAVAPTSIVNVSGADRHSTFDVLVW